MVQTVRTAVEVIFDILFLCVLTHVHVQAIHICHYYYHCLNFTFYVMQLMEIVGTPSAAHYGRLHWHSHANLKNLLKALDLSLEQ